MLGARVSGGLLSSSRLIICAAPAGSRCGEGRAEPQHGGKSVAAGVHAQRTVAHRRADAVGASVAAADDHHLLPRSAHVLAILQPAVQQALGVGVQELHRKVHAAQVAALDRQVARLCGAGGQHHRVMGVPASARRGGTREQRAVGRPQARHARCCSKRTQACRGAGRSQGIQAHLSSPMSTLRPTCADVTNVMPSAAIRSTRRCTMSSLSVFMLGTPYIIRPPMRSERSYTACAERNHMPRRAHGVARKHAAHTRDVADLSRCGPPCSAGRRQPCPPARHQSPPRSCPCAREGAEGGSSPRQSPARAGQGQAAVRCSMLERDHDLNHPAAARLPCPRWTPPSS